MKIISSLMLALAVFAAPATLAQDATCKYSFKTYGSIGLGDAYSSGFSTGAISAGKSSNSSFGIDFGYRCWQHGNVSLGVNTGLGVSMGNQEFSANEMSFSYMAPAYADMDGDTYMRYTQVSPMVQKIKSAEFGIPVYADLNFQLHKRFSLYVMAGVKILVSLSAKTTSLAGMCDAWGVYPQYDNLLIDEEWLNDFCNSALDDSMADNASHRPFLFNAMAGAGVRVGLFGPLTFECGIGYEYGLVGTFKGTGWVETGKITEAVAPVVYTVKGGRRVKPLTAAMTKDNLSNLTLNVGLIWRF